MPTPKKKKPADNTMLPPPLEKLKQGRVPLPQSFDRTPPNEINPGSISQYNPNPEQEHLMNRFNQSEGERNNDDMGAIINMLSLGSGLGAPKAAMQMPARMGGTAMQKLEPPPIGPLEGIADDALIANQPVTQFPPPPRMSPQEMFDRATALRAQMRPQLDDLSGSTTNMSPTMNMRPPPLGPSGMPGDELLQNAPVFLDPKIRNHIAPPMGESAMMQGLNDLNKVNPVGADGIQRLAASQGAFNRPASGSLETPLPASGSTGNMMQQGNSEMLRNFNNMTSQQQLQTLLAALGIGGSAASGEPDMQPPPQF